ncbi:MAG: hypothetical protein ACYCW6_16135 [Candidatus Xenobia bacterium]
MFDAETKQALRSGKTLKFKVTTNDLSPQLRMGDYVAVRRTDMGSLRTGDVVLCCVDLQSALKRVRRVIRSGGVEVAEVESKRDTVTCLGEGAVLGKVVHIQRSEQPAQGLLGAVRQVLQSFVPRETTRR